jgi:serine/threonine-protein kinase
VYDTGEDVVTDPTTGAVGHVPFIVMEYVEGHTVRDILRDGQAVPIDEAIEITAGVLSALEYSHHAGIVHRDIKPANVMLTPTGAVKVMDFGIARALADSAATMTQTQAVIGTAQYLSPEQARGETVDARSDLYSAGCLLFELLTGRPPFVGDSPVAVAYQHVREIAPAPSSVASDVPETLDRICAKALAKERDARYSSAAEFRADLEAAARGGHVNAPAVAAAALGAGAATQVMDPAAATAATQLVPGAGPAWAPTSPGTSVLPTATDGPEDDEPESSKRWLWITLIIVGVLAVGGIIALILSQGNKEEEPQTTPVPSVVNLAEADAAAALTDAGFNPVRQSEASDTVAEGLVTRTDPTAGTEAEDGSDVSYWVSAGPNSVTLPDLSGLTQDQARDQIEELGLTVGAITQADEPDQPEGRVLRSDPANGQAVTADQPVALIISSGRVQLADMTGQTQDAAVAALNALKLSANVVTEETSDPAQVGTVIRQDRSAGLVPQGTVVKLTVGVAATSAQIPSNIVGMSEEDATNALKALGFTDIRVVGSTSASVAEGNVMSSSPAPGTTASLTSTVTLTVSEGPPAGSNNGSGNGNGNTNP